MTIRKAGTVLLFREGETGVEVFLVRRHRGSGFMAGAFVFPGGVAEEQDRGEIRVTAGRELFEEAGVLIGTGPSLDSWRERFNAGRASWNEFESAGGSLVLDDFCYFATWVTPSIEKRRYEATFFACLLPDGQVPSFDAKETIDERWVSPKDGLAQAKELHLPPPQLRSLWELREARSWTDVKELCARRIKAPHAVLPRMMPAESETSGFMLLLPWDPDYQSQGTGEGIPIADNHPLAIGPSRFALRDGEWVHFSK